MSFALAGLPLQTVAIPTYDEQIGATFTQDLGALNYNVSAVAQTDANGYGPAYILNGVTTTGYWYQVGISYNWPAIGGGHTPGFSFSYQVYSPGGRPAYPSSGSGRGNFSQPVSSGDTVLLSLTFSGKTVQMSALDWQTGGVASASFSSEGSSTFVGNPSAPIDSSGYFTGIMTEWYHVGIYTGGGEKVTYTNHAVALDSAWLWADEYESGGSGGAGATIFFEKTPTPVTFSTDEQLHHLETNGASIYGSAHKFITGQLNSATSSVTLEPAYPATGNATLVASYTLAGLQQSAALTPGKASLIEADPGTSITLSASGSSPAPSTQWVFSGGPSGGSVTLPAGQNATYVYYELVEEAVSASSSGGPPLPSPPALIYETPPSSPGSSPAVTTVVQGLSSSPVSIFAVVGSQVNLTTIMPSGSQDARWATATQNFTVPDTPYAIPNPVVYHFQYYLTYGVNDPLGGKIEASSGWYDAGSAINATASANEGWQFQGWYGTYGYSGAPLTRGELPTTVDGSFILNATFFPELTVVAPSGVDVHYFYNNTDANSSHWESGLFPAGTTKSIYVQPSTDVVLTARPSNFLYSFGSWVGGSTGANATVTVRVGSPTTVEATSTLDYLVIGGLAVATVAAVLLSAALLVRRNRRKPRRLSSGQGPD